MKFPTQVMIERLRVEEIIRVFLPGSFLKLQSYQSKQNRQIAAERKKHATTK